MARASSAVRQRSAAVVRPPHVPHVRRASSQACAPTGVGLGSPPSGVCDPRLAYGPRPVRPASVRGMMNTSPDRQLEVGDAPRSPAESHRTATPLELFFDLWFVVAVAQAANSLHHALADGHAADGVVGYPLVFFAIWWAWMNFTWFASAYDNDDVLYRLAGLRPDRRRADPRRRRAAALERPRLRCRRRSAT